MIYFICLFFFNIISQILDKDNLSKSTMPFLNDDFKKLSTPETYVISMWKSN